MPCAHAAIMPTAEGNSPPYTDADYYGFFMTGLFGLVDDAELSGYSPEGIALLREAQDLFWREFRKRHPDAWTDKALPSE
jgi:hypothetical protein